MGGTWLAWTGAITPAQNKYHLTVWSDTSSSGYVTLKGLYCVDLQTAAITGALQQYNFEMITGGPPTGGTSVTPIATDPASVLNSGVSVRSAPNGGVVDGSLLYSLFVLAEEQTVTEPLTGAIYEQFKNHLLVPIMLRSNGFAVKQITNSTVGSFAWLLVFEDMV